MRNAVNFLSICQVFSFQSVLCMLSNSYACTWKRRVKNATRFNLRASVFQSFPGGGHAPRPPSHCMLCMQCALHSILGLMTQNLPNHNIPHTHTHTYTLHTYILQTHTHTLQILQTHTHKLTIHPASTISVVRNW